MRTIRKARSDCFTFTVEYGDRAVDFGPDERAAREAAAQPGATVFRTHKGFFSLAQPAAAAVAAGRLEAERRAGMSRAKALDKVRKCLALSGSPNAHEAAAAARQAGKLMAMHDISSAEVAA